MTTLWHNPNCGTSRKVLAALQQAGHDVRVRLYIKEAPSTDEIRAVLTQMGEGPRALLRQRGTPYDALGLDDVALSDDALIQAMADHPILIERPVIITAKGALLCRPAERWKDLFLHE